LPEGTGGNRLSVRPGRFPQLSARRPAARTGSGGTPQGACTISIAHPPAKPPGQRSSGAEPASDGWFEPAPEPPRRRLLARLLDALRRQGRWPRLALIGLVVVALVAGLLATETLATAGRVRRGVRVGGVDLSGLTPAAAGARLREAAAPVEASPLVLEAAGASLRLPRSQAGVELDIEASVAAAMATGRGWALDPDRFKGWFGRIDLPWQARVDPGRLQRQLATLDRRVGSHVREPGLRIGTLITGAEGAGSGGPGSGGAGEAGASDQPGAGAGAGQEAVPVELVPGRPGRAVDRAGAEAALRAAAAAPAGTTVRLPIGERPPSVATAAAQATADRAARLLAASVEVTAGQGRVELLPAELAPLVRTQVAAGQLRLGLDPGGLDRLLRRRAPFAYTEPKDASFQPSGGGIRLLPAVTGLRADPRKAAAAVLEAGTAGAGAARTAALPTARTEPELTTKEAKALGVKEVMSTFTTTFNAGDVPRVHNIGLIAAAVHGRLVMPGQVFSMNEATGQRTAAKGYRTAHVIQNGEIVDGLGGGVCQAGTTMFNTAFFAGLPVVERRNHSLHISHYPMGRDATLNWPGTDLKFRNDSRYGIYITSQATPSTLTFTFWSTSRGYKVTSSTSAARNFRAPSTRFKDDPTLPKGKEVVEESGASGFDVTVFRTVTKGGTVVRRDSFVSNYSPWVRVVRRGTKEPAATPGPGGSA
jgi:vancomycin resistance protein YoaR